MADRNMLKAFGPFNAFHEDFAHEIMRRHTDEGRELGPDKMLAVDVPTNGVRFTSEGAFDAVFEAVAQRHPGFVKSMDVRAVRVGALNYANRCIDILVRDLSALGVEIRTAGGKYDGFSASDQAMGTISGPGVHDPLRRLAVCHRASAGKEIGGLGLTVPNETAFDALHGEPPIPAASAAGVLAAEPKRVAPPERDRSVIQPWPPGVEERALELLREGKFDEAVKYRRSKVGLEAPSDSRNEVNALARKHGLPTKGCFIATACCDSADAPEVVALRHFRDDRLLRSRLGRALVAVYYRASPRVADWIRERPLLRRAVRTAAIRPLAGLVDRGCAARSADEREERQ